jgi:hypothetical protein
MGLGEFAKVEGFPFVPLALLLAAAPAPPPPIVTVIGLAGIVNFVPPGNEVR